ncbi:MAG: hypothetical protein GWM90_28435, partial [Gemmatimonadetes bacterium]|nr:hypothetical protein [Gemmatimonadota bacterium]NIQ58967.1 hypothetical protein [Gemmatimonadota bacterium]NIU79170.1 hypothetical protein [Gammaproteobacteria bacterium]NIX47855.1 hypothetical protein [Gemmatimonadota bacterium]NIY12226.1 hypothetical protein [Gemmatimonadota bacterium]
MTLPPVPDGWPELADERRKPYFRALEEFVDAEYRDGPVYPARQEVFRALEL